MHIAQELSSARVERAMPQKGLRATMVRLLLITLFGGCCILANGHTTVHSDALPAARLVAQEESLKSAQQPTASPQQPTPTPDWAREFELLKITVESELGAVESKLGASERGIAALQEANDRSFYLVASITGVVTLFGLATLVTTWTKGKHEHQDYKEERDFYEKRALDYEDRREGEHKAILRLYGEQLKTHRGENAHAGKMFTLQEANLTQVNNITTAIAAGAQQNVESLNTILSTFQQIMDFKVEEVETSRKAIEQMESELEKLKNAQRQQVEELLSSSVRLRRSRHIYTSPDPDLRRQMEEFRTQMDSMPRVVLDRCTGVESPAENRRCGEIYLRRGIIAYYDNDVLKSREMLRIAEPFYSFSEQEIRSMPRDQKLPIAFTQYYLALIQKNYGEMAVAKDHIEKAYAVYGQNEPEELLTPATRAEILSYLGDMDDARAAIQEVLDRAEDLQQSGRLQRHDAIYALRARLLLGNTYYVEGKWQQALQHYEDTLEADERRDNSYYAYHSIAQVYHQLGDEEQAQENKRKAYDELVSTGHLRTKVALDTRILLNALAYHCTRADMPEKAKEHKEAIQELWLRIHEVNGLQLRLFSFERRLPISKEKFWAEVFS